MSIFSTIKAQNVEKKRLKIIQIRKSFKNNVLKNTINSKISKKNLKKFPIFFLIFDNFQTMLVLYRRKSHLTSNDETRRRRRVEIRFFTQSCLQGILFFYEVFNFYYIVTLNTNQWFVFMTSTFAWELCHCLDG